MKGRVDGRDLLNADQVRAKQHRDERGHDQIEISIVPTFHHLPKIVTKKEASLESGLLPINEKEKTMQFSDRRNGSYAISLTCFVSRDLYRAAVLRWMMPLFTALSINEMVGLTSLRLPLCRGRLPPLEGS